MVVGFTGTQKGMTAPQMQALEIYLRHIKPEVAHHGDCIGADEQFHNKCAELGIPIIIHPPVDEKKRAFCSNGQCVAPKPYIERNHDIVDASDILIATPFEVKEQLRSGTWATIRYAKKKPIPVVQITPSGMYIYTWSSATDKDKFLITRIQ